MTHAFFLFLIFRAIHLGGILSSMFCNCLDTYFSNVSFFSKKRVFSAAAPGKSKPSSVWVRYGPYTFSLGESNFRNFRSQADYPILHFRPHCPSCLRLQGGPIRPGCIYLFGLLGPDGPVRNCLLFGFESTNLRSFSVRDGTNRNRTGKLHNSPTQLKYLLK